MKKIGVMLLVMALSLVIPVKIKAQDELFGEVLSPSVVLMDASNMRVLYNKNGEEKHYPASTTKIMTMLLALENGALSSQITFSEYAVMSIEYGSSHISLQPGETITLQQALYATNLASANDACNGIAEALGGSIDHFVEMMNDRAAEIGCTNTHFVNPHGLHDDDHYTTAVDLAKIMSTIVKNPQYLQLTQVLETTIPPTNKTSETRYLYTTNRCMDEDNEYYISEVLAAKSGYTDQAQHTYVAYAKKGNVELVAAFMNVENREDYYKDLKNILNKAFEIYTAYDDVNELVRCPSISKKFLYSGGKTYLESAFSIPCYTENEKASFYVTYDIDENANEKAVGEKVGTANLYFDTTLIQTRDLLLENKLKSPLQTLLGWLLTLIIWIVILLVSAVILLVAAKKIYTKYKRYQRRQKRKSQS